MQNTPPRQLPVRLPPVADELLSSWINRHAAFYAVPPLVMLRHCLPKVVSLRAADLHLSRDQEIRLASMFSTDPAVVRRMTFGNVVQSSHRLLAAGPAQVCTNCSLGHTEPAPILRSQLLGWRITCPLCANQFRDSGGRELPPLSGNIVVWLFVAKSCSTRKPNVASEPGHRPPTLPGFS